MGLFTYLSEEIYKTVNNCKQIFISFFITFLLYSFFSSLAYQNWNYLLNLHSDDFYFRYLGPQVCHLLYMFSIHLMLCFIYEYKFEVFEQYKHVSAFPWEKDPVGWNRLYNRTFGNYIVNQCLVLPIHGFIFMKFGESYLITKEEFPGFCEMFWQILFFHFCNDLFLFVEHVIMHTNFFYNFIHKFHHEHSNVVGISSDYFHPIEFFLILTAAVIGPNLFNCLFGYKVHIFTFVAWQMINIYDNVVQNYSGYNFPWRPNGILPFQNGPGYHYYHQGSSIDRGCYSFSYNFFDRIFGWDQEFNREMREARSGKVKDN